jgi:aspartate carbamoyltransferase catalytic subunit
MSLNHLLSAKDLDTSEIRYLLSAAKALKGPVDAGEPIPLLAGKTIVNLFFENSTRTRLSFELATRRLGGGTLNFAASGSSVSKGETLIDTAQNILAMRPHCLVLRHSSAGSPVFLARNVNVPVINAGDGFHEHPSQALLDALTMEEKIGDLRGKCVLIIGDIAHSRVARSNIAVLTKLGAKVAVCGPPTLLPPQVESLGVEFSYRPEKLLPQADVVMCLRIQFERQNKMQIPSIAEYSRIWGMNRERAKLLKPGAIILHPGPVNRGVELDAEVADGEHSVILDQVSNGVLIRMAILAAVCNRAGLDQWVRGRTV